MAEEISGDVSEGTCPLCKQSMTVRSNVDEIPYFGEVMFISLNCDCGFRHADTLILSEREPKRFELTIEEEGDLSARVIRSTSGTIRIPHLGIDVEPGPASESFITNVEGLLDRVQDVVVMAVGWAETDEQREHGERILESLTLAADAQERITIVLEDPLGNSAIVSEKARERTLTPEEAEALQTGMYIIDDAIDNGA